MPEAVPSAEQVRAALDQLLDWPGISRSPQLSDLLRYVVDKTLSGDDASIKAYSIAVDVFGRPQSFDPQTDPIVRVQARRLRTLLEQFYDSGKSESAVQIRLPLGRYVPEFKLTTGGTQGPGGGLPADAVAKPGTGAPSRRSRFVVNALLGLAFTLVGVGLAVLLIRWALPTAPVPSGEALPEVPQITMGAFDNLTGDPSLDAGVNSLGTRVSVALAHFENVAVSTTGGGAQLSGVMQRTNDAFVLKAILTRSGGGGGIIWSSSIDAGPGGPNQDWLGQIATKLTRQITAARGPLQQPGRTWLAGQATAPQHPNDYVCRLSFDNWRETRVEETALAAVNCYQTLLDANPNDALALAGISTVASWRAEGEARPGEQLVALLTNERAGLDRAIKILPSSSFVSEQRAVLLARQGSVTDSLQAIDRAVELNPNNMDAVANKAVFLTLTGDWQRGADLAAEALAAAPTSPPWYYMSPAFNFLRTRQYFDAVDAASALAAGEPDLGPVLVLAAAAQSARLDLIERYRPLVLANPGFRSGGILPRLSVYLRQQVLVDRLREGLILGGIPPNALDGAFNPDGSPRG